MVRTSYLAHGRTPIRTGIPRRAIVLGVVIGLLIAGAAAAIVWSLRVDTWAASLRSGRDVARSLSHDIERSLESYDLSLRSVANDLRTPELMKLPADVRARVLFDSSAKAKYLGPIRVLDRDGVVVLDSTDPRPRRTNLRTTPYFAYHATHADAQLLIGHPFVDDAGRDRIALSRRITQDDGGFGGVVVGTIELAYFEDLFSKLDLGERSTVSLVLDDGTLTMRYPHGPTDIGRNLKGTLPFDRLVVLREGDLEARATIDGVRRRYVFTQVGAYPLSMLVGRSTDAIYGAWVREASWIALFTLALLFGCGLLAFILRRELVLRSQAEAALSTLNAKLAGLAAEDGLTTLPNRRTFDQAIEVQCLRFNRSRDPLALLMIDIDRFKAFNDRFGHPQGDACIRAVADALRASIARPDDFVARYGGEEFVMLLPATDAAGALAVAERLRASVRERAIPHDGVVSDLVTISIGAGVLARGSQATTPAALIELADRALYAAKNNGRDRVEMSVTAGAVAAVALAPA